MSNIENPYQSPETTSIPLSTIPSQGNLTETMLVYLKGASPWLRFVGIMGFISTGIMVIWGIASIALLSIFSQLWYSSYDYFAPGAGMMIGSITGIAIIGSSALIFFPSLFIYRFGSKIKKYLESGNDIELEQAFKNNKSLWKFAGILIIVNIAIIPVMLIIAVIAGLFWAFL